MDFLKDIIGEELYSKLVEKINGHNGDEANKDKQIKLGNLASGEYVGKLKYDDIVQQLQGKQGELDTANGLIEELKKGTKGNEGLQQKISEYEATVQQLQAQLQETKIKSAVKVALLSEKAVDVEYLTFKLNEKLKEKGETLELDENDNIKGWDGKIEGLKTQFPNMFESAGEGGDGFKPYKPEGLPNDKGGQTVTKEQFNKMGYEERVKLKQKNEELYRKLAKH